MPVLSFRGNSAGNQSEGLLQTREGVEHLGWPAEVGAAASCTDGTFGLAGKNDKYTIRILYISFYYSFTYKTLYKYEVLGGNQKISIGFGRKSKDFNRFWEEIARRSESSGVGN